MYTCDRFFPGRHNLVTDKANCNRRLLRELIASDGVLLIPGTGDCLSAILIQKVGFPAVYMSGLGTSFTLLGMPDAGLITMSEMVDNAKRIANAVDVPVISDSDTGFGNAVNVVRTVNEFIQAGVAAIHIEDQVLSKRCGHVAGKMLIPLEEMAGKIRAASDARKETDPDFVLIARTDSRGAVGGGFDEVRRRAHAYAEAGADVLFADGIRSEEEMSRLVREIPIPWLYNQSSPPHSVSPRLPLPVLQEIGVAMTIYPAATMRPALRAVWDHLIRLRELGIQAAIDLDHSLEGHPTEEVFDVIGYKEIRALEEAYLPEADMERYKQESLGMRY
jgi:2-methylisocitrate lyase-like PEP mutase family enzyme